MEARVQPESTLQDAAHPTAVTGVDGSAAAASGTGVSALRAAQPWLAGTLIAAGIVLLVVLLAHAMRRRPASANPARSGDSAQLTDLAADVEELTSRLAAQLDAKAAKLESLLAEADDAIARLERAAAPRATGRAGAAEGSGRAGASGGGPTADDDLADPITRDVYRLADEGCSPVQIAQRLEQHTGKVELILALRNV